MLVAAELLTSALLFFPRLAWQTTLKAVTLKPHFIQETYTQRLCRMHSATCVLQASGLYGVVSINSFKC